jgi:plasmid stability protein
MPILTIRNLQEHGYSALRRLAAQDGLSVEAEVRTIITNACNAKKPVANSQQLVDRSIKEESQCKRMCRGMKRIISERCASFVSASELNFEYAPRFLNIASRVHTTILLAELIQAKKVDHMMLKG